MSDVGKIEVSLVLNGAESFPNDVKRAADSLDKISVSLDKYGGSTKTARSHTNSLLATMRDYTIIFGGAHHAIQMVNDALVSLPRSILSNNAALERNKVLLSGMETGANSFAEAQRKANDELSGLLKTSAKAPYSLDAILDSYTKLRTGGIDNTVESMKALMDTASMSGATSDQLKHASVAIQQMAGKGVISMEELRGQLGEAVPQAMNIMSRAVGMNMNDMVKLISTGGMEATSALKLFFREMKLENDGAAIDIADTWTGTVEQIKKTWSMLVSDNGNGSEFFSAMKSELTELNSALKTNEAKRMVSDIDSSLASLVRGVATASKSIYNNFDNISYALAGLFAFKTTASGVSALSAAFMPLRTAVSNMFFEFDKFDRKQAEAIANVAKRKDAIAAINKAYNDSIRLGLQSTDVMKQAYAAERDAALKAANEIGNTSRSLNLLNGSMNAVKAGASALYTAIGGAFGLAVITITGILVLMDKYIWSQDRLNQKLMETKGLNATIDELERSRLNVGNLNNAKKDVDASKAALKLLEDQQKREGVTGNGFTQMEIERSKVSLQQAEARLQVAQDENKLNLEINRTAQSSVDDQNRMNGSLLVEQQIREQIKKTQDEMKQTKISTLEKYKGEADTPEKRAKISTADAAAEKNELDAQVQIYQGALDKYQSKLDEFREKNKGINLLDSKNNGLNRDYQQLIGSVSTLNEKLTDTKLLAAQPRGVLETFTPKKAKQDADPGKTVEDNIDIQIAKLQEKYRALQSNTDMETKSAELEARIANGQFKGKSDSFIESLREKYKLADELGNKVKDYQSDLKVASEAEKGIINQTVALRKKVAKSDVDSNNPFLQWKKTSESEKAALDERISQMEKVGQYNEKARKEVAEATQLIAQMDQNNMEDMISEKDKELTKSLMSTRQAARAQHDDELQHLEAFRIEIEKMQNSPAKTHMMQQINDVRTKMNSAYDQNNDPFKKWLKSSQDLAENLDTKLMGSFDGVFDAVAAKIVDTTTNFGDMIRSLCDDLQKYVVKLALIEALKAAITGFGGGNYLSSLGLGGGSTTTGVGQSVSAMGSGSGGVGASYSSMPSFDISNFANGGIMTEFGSLPLKKYANGGVASSPQVALFGEGKMNEAYVPLPDGRTIPVTMQGGQQQVSPIGVSVNVINQSGTQLDAEQSSAPRFDGESYIVDVVLRNISRPGTLRTAVKGAK